MHNKKHAELFSSLCVCVCVLCVVCVCVCVCVWLPSLSLYSVKPALVVDSWLS